MTAARNHHGGTMLTVHINELGGTASQETLLEIDEITNSEPLIEAFTTRTDLAKDRND